MTPEECKRVRDAVPVAFPSIAAWWDKLKDDKTRAAMERRNTACLIDCDYADVMAVLADMGRSPIDPWPYDSDKERAAAIIAQRANELRSERKQAERVKSDTTTTGRRYSRPAGLQSLWDAAEELIKFKATDGWTDEQTAAWLVQKFPEDPHDKRDWIQCTACGDTGLILCLATIQRIEEHIVHTTGVAACHCQRGEVFATRKDERARLQRYNELEHVRIPAGCSGATAAELLAAAGTRRDEAKRLGSFDDFNNREPERAF